MLLLLPPSETKRDGGLDDTALDLRALSFPELLPPRRTALAALRALSRNVGASHTALRLSPKQRFEIDRNRAVGTSPLLPAIDRYTGVLYDALGAESLSQAARAFAGEHVAIHSALFGLVAATDGIPAYRLSHDSRLPALSLRRHWAAPISRSLAAREGLVLDLRSESYGHLGPAPDSAWYVRVVARRRRPGRSTTSTSTARASSRERCSSPDSITRPSTRSSIGRPRRGSSCTVRVASSSSRCTARVWL